MTAASAAGAWGGSLERKQSVVAAVSAALSGNPLAWPYPALEVYRHEDGPANGNGYCLAFDTVDPAELEAKSGLPADVLRLIGGALCACTFQKWRDFKAEVYMTPVAKDCLVEALEAIRPGADLDALPGRYVVALLRNLQDLLPAVDGVAGAAGAPLTVAIKRIAQLHRDALVGRVSDSVTWSAARRAAVTATDAVTTPAGTAIAQFVEAVAWPIDGLVPELPDLLLLHMSLFGHLARMRRPAEVQAVMDRYNQALGDLLKLQAEATPPHDQAWLDARIAESPEAQAYKQPEFQARLDALFCEACDEYGPRSHRVLMDTLRQL